MQRLATLSLISAFATGAFASCGSDTTPGAGFAAAGGAAASGGAVSLDGSAAKAGSSGTVGWEASSLEVSSSDTISEVCAAMTKQAVLEPANLLFVGGRTGPMNCSPPPTPTTAQCEQTPAKKEPLLPSKWEIVADALKAAVRLLEKVQPLPSVGIMYFNNDDYCGYPNKPDVDILALTDGQATAINSTLDQVSPWGATPIIGAMMRGYEYLRSNAARFSGNRFVVLLTDGGETCDPTNTGLLVQKAAEAGSIGIRTFVLGAPGSESYRAFLSQIAFNGGTPSTPACDHSGSGADKGDCHMDMTLPNTDFATELAKNLAAISTEALSCEFDVPDPGDGSVLDPWKVNVKYTPGAGGAPVQFPRNDNYACNDPLNNGWQYSADGKKIELCGSACKTVKSDGGAKVSIVLGCKTEEAPK